MFDDPHIPTGDDEFLDGVFERALDEIEQGRMVDPASLLAGREHLRDQVIEAVALARRVAVGRTPPATALPTLSGYTILKELGRGGMGAVFLARQEKLGGRLVALKVLPQTVSLSERARERFRSEARAIAKLRHPHIVAVHDVIEERGVYAFTMELVDGPSLAQLIDEGRDPGESKQPPCGDPSRAVPSPDRAADGPALNVARPRGTPGPVVASLGRLVPWSLEPSGVCRLGIAIARALGEVHRAGLLHRDVKPSNILLRKVGTPLLSDFGLAKTTDDSPLSAQTLTATGGFLGTPAYAAPEQLRGEGDALDPRTDVYALGVTLYHALALRIPFRGRTSNEVLRQIEAGRAEPLRKVNPRLPRDLETIVATAMDADPDRRYPTADELADDLERLLSLQPIHARPAGVVTRGIKLVRRNRASFAAGVVGSTLGIGVMIVLGMYFFLVPGWVAGRLREARLALLDPDQALALHWAVFKGEPSGRITDAQLNRPALEAALKRYDAALRWSPFDEDIRAEREVVRSVRDQGAQGPRDEGGAPALRAGGRSARASAPERETDAKALVAPQSVPHPGGVGHPSPSSVPADLRFAGLRAFLLRDVDAAVAAWSEYESRHDQTQDPDPFVAAALGLLHLVQDRPALAYPRLRDAVQGFPGVGFLTVYLADAAVQCGDLAEARRLLDKAGALPMRDAQGGLERVEADLAGAEGRTAEAEVL